MKSVDSILRSERDRAANAASKKADLEPAGVAMYEQGLAKLGNARIAGMDANKLKGHQTRRVRHDRNAFRNVVLPESIAKQVKVKS